MYRGLGKSMHVFLSKISLFENTFLVVEGMTVEEY